MKGIPNATDSSPDGSLGHQQDWEELPESVKNRALAQAIIALGNQGRGPISPERLTEALGPDQLRCVADNISLSEEQLATIGEGIQPDNISFSEEQLATIGEGIQPDNISLSEEQLATIGEGIQPGGMWESEMIATEGSASESVVATITRHFLDYPAASFYAISVGVMMIALYLSSPLIALSGVSVMLITIAHYAV